MTLAVALAEEEATREVIQLLAPNAHHERRTNLIQVNLLLTSSTSSSTQKCGEKKKAQKLFWDCLNSHE
jgi:hypothetical protein